MNGPEFNIPFEKLNTLSFAYFQDLLIKIPNIIKQLNISLNAHISLPNKKNVTELKEIFRQLELNNVYQSLQVLEVYINSHDIRNAKKQMRQVEALSGKALKLLKEYVKPKK